MKRFYLIALFIIPFFASAQQVVVKGRIADQNGDILPLASVMLLPDSTIVTSDLNGDFTINTRKGQKKFRVSYTGFQNKEFTAQILKDTVINIRLKESAAQLQEVVVASDRFSSQDKVGATSSGSVTLTQKDLLDIPALLGEPDLIKAIQLLPGSVKGMAGTSDVFVRGGAADQNLVLLDGAPVYNTSYLFGFLSIFNPDVVDNVEAINGGFPAEFGGRLSSVLNVNTKSTIPDQTRVSADIGMIASRVMLEQPVIKDKASFWITGRRTYVDKVARIAGANVPYYFFDVNGKVIFHPTKTDEMEFSYFTGSDMLDHFRDRDGNGRGTLTRGNTLSSTQSLKWKHHIPGHWSNNLSIFRTDYSYRIKNAVTDYSLSAMSNIHDFGSKFWLQKDSLWGDATVTAGVEWVNHNLSPNVVNSAGTITEKIGNSASPAMSTHELSIYVQQEWTLVPKLRVNVGLRTSAAINGERYYAYPEPRLSARYALNEDQALKFNYSRMVQYIHRISNAAVSTPTDIWYPITDKVRPQRSHQYSLAWQKFIPDNQVFVSVEGYYKSMTDLIAYEEGTNLMFNTNFASQLIQGDGKAYGMEMLIKKESGNFTGWISYNLAWSWRQFNELNNGDWFHARYDRRHNGAVVAQHRLGHRWAVSGVWEYISGARFTPIVGQYLTSAPNMAGVDLIPIFAPINSVRLSDAHRLDLGVKFFSKPNVKMQWTLAAGAYNVYNRNTPLGIVIEENKRDKSLRYRQPGLIGFLPYVSFGCKF